MTVPVIRIHSKGEVVDQRLHEAWDCPETAGPRIAKYEAALAAGGTDNAPGIRPHFPNYYAAYGGDPDRQQPSKRFTARRFTHRETFLADTRRAARVSGLRSRRSLRA